MSNLLNIIYGWKNVAFKNEEVEKLALSRAKICDTCEHAVEGSIEVIEKTELKIIQKLKCKLCQCPLSAKTRSKKEKCDKNKW